jgi:hypothetical protein
MVPYEPLPLAFLVIYYKSAQCLHHIQPQLEATCLPLKLSVISRLLAVVSKPLYAYHFLIFFFSSFKFFFGGTGV